MKREEITSLIVYMIVLAAAVILGFTVIQPHYMSGMTSFHNGFLYGLFVLGAVLSGIILAAIFEELGHIVGAKIGKYEIVSVSILHFTFQKNNEGKFKFKFTNYDGLTGETKIRPLNENSNPTSYLFTGTAFNAIIAVGLIILFYIFKDTKGIVSDFGFFFLTAGATVMTCLIYNILPLKLENKNDGYRLAMVSNPKNKEAFNELLRVEYEIACGNEDVEIKTFIELTDFTAELNMNKMCIYLDKGQYDKVDDLLDIVFANKDSVSNNVYFHAVAMRTYIYAFMKTREEMAKFVEEQITMEIRKDMSNDKDLLSIRAYILIAGLFDNSKSECLIALKNVNKAYQKVEKTRKESEKVFFNKALDLVVEAHPKWELEKYQIVDTTK